MANTYILIEAQTLGSSAASVTLGSGGTIPQIYTDLKLVFSVRHVGVNEISNDVLISFNGSTANFTSRRYYGSGSTIGGDTSARTVGTTVGQTAGSNIFGNNELYIPNYTTSNYKSYSSDQAGENSAQGAYLIQAAGLWSDTAAITSITLSPGAGSFVQHSTFYLYGIKKS
jgi:hypothetical protein